MWKAPSPELRDGPLTGPERPMLEAYLAWQRTTLLNICAGLSAEQLARRPLASSQLSLLGLVRHLAKVERTWFRQRAGRQDIEALHTAAGQAPDFDCLDPAGAPGDFAALQDEWRLADEAVAAVGCDDTFAVGDEVFSLRMTYVHMIGEYSRHNGHADLLREAIDGTRGR